MMPHVDPYISQRTVSLPSLPHLPKRTLIVIMWTSSGRSSRAGGGHLLAMMDRGEVNVLYDACKVLYRRGLRGASHI